MIDYDKTIKQALYKAMEYLTQLAKKAPDKHKYKLILDNIKKLDKIITNPEKYCDYRERVKDNLVLDAEAFMPNERDNSKYLAVSQVMHAADIYYSRLKEGTLMDNTTKELLNKIKAMNYQMSSSWLRDFTYPFKSVKSFAVQEKIK